MRGQIVLAWRATGPIGPAARALIDHARAALESPCWIVSAVSDGSTPPREALSL